MPKPNPLLESDSVECAHQGKIVAFSNNKMLEVDGSCVLTKQDLLQAQIIGCTHQVAGFSTPCKAIVTILDSALSNTLIINGDSAIIAQQISQIFTDNGAPLRFKNGATPKAKDIFELDEDIADFDNTQNGNENAESMSESSAESSENLDTKSNEIFTPLPQRYASNDDMAFKDSIKRQEWEKFKKYYLNIHKVNNTEIKEAKERIGEDKLQEWKIMFGDNIDIFIKAEARYYKIGKAIHKEFMEHPSNYVNTCAARISKALYDYGIHIKRLSGMKSAYLANAGTNAKPYKILVKVKDMITFLKESEHFGKTIEFEPNKKQTNQQFCKETLSNLNDNGIVAMDIMGWEDANGHIVPWDNDNKTFLDGKDFLGNGGKDYIVTKVYFWKIP